MTENNEIPTVRKSIIKVIAPYLIIALLLPLNFLQFQAGRDSKAEFGKASENFKSKDAQLQKLMGEINEQKLEIETTKGILAQKELENSKLQEKIKKLQKKKKR